MDAESSVARTEHVAEGSRIDPSQIVRPSASRRAALYLPRRLSQPGQ